jgi:branched-chain amino acid transport system ATP-binding protein
MSLLEVAGLNSYYGDSHILFDVGLRVERNEVVALVGRNGAGKSTTLKTLMGMVAPRSGSVKLDGVETAGWKSHAIARAGMQLVPEDRRIFGSLEVEENLALAALTAPKRWPLERIYAMFPRLKERRRSRGTDLSGGEQQMLAIARALVRDPEIVLLDEPFEGLAPVIVHDLVAACRTLAEAGQTIVLSTGYLYVDKSLTIEGPVPAGMTISGGFLDRVFLTDFNTDVVFRNLAIVNGNDQTSSGGGGGIWTTENCCWTTFSLRTIRPGIPAAAFS